MSQSAAHTQQVAEEQSFLLRPMQYGSVPAVDGRYWTVMALASILGCNTGDDCSFYAGWNHWIGLGPLALIFAALIAGERRSAGHSEGWYWAAVLVLRTAATNLADLATHTFALPYPLVLAALSILQVLVIWRTAPRLLEASEGAPSRPAITGWYWFSLLTAGTLGTVFLVILALGKRVHWATKLSYWPAVLAVRAAGTTAGDWLAFREDPGLHNGLHLGLPFSTSVSGILFLAVLFAWKKRASSPSDGIIP